MDLNRQYKRIESLSPAQRKLLEKRLKAEGLTLPKERKGFSAIVSVEKKEYYAASSAQKRLFVLQQMNSAGTGYNVPGVIPLQEKPDPEELSTALKKLIRRHEGLRTSFELINEKPAQRIHDSDGFGFNLEYTKLCRAEDSPEIKNYIKEFVKPFDLSKPPLLRVGLLEIAGSTYILLFDIHHIVTDNKSQAILKEDFMSIYTGEDLPPLRFQYKDFAMWQSSPEQQESIKKQESYWLELFSGELPVLELPSDFPRPEVLRFEGAFLDVVLSKEESRTLRKIAKENAATLFMTVLSIFNILLAKLSGQEDIIVGTPVAFRSALDPERVVGMFVNTIPIRLYPARKKTFKNFLAEVKQQTSAAFGNQEYQFETLVDKIGVKRDSSRNPIFDVLLSFTADHKYKDNPSVFEKGHKTADYVKVVSKFDLILDIMELGDSILVNFKYSINLFNRETIERFLCYFRRIIADLSCDTGKKIADMEILSRAEKREIVERIRKEKSKVFAGKEKRAGNELKNSDVGFNF
jgi:hypothetical protein